MDRIEVIELVPYEHYAKDGKFHLKSKDGKVQFGIDFEYRYKICEVYGGIITPDLQPHNCSTKWFYHRSISSREMVRRYLKTSNKRTWRQECNKLKIRSAHDY